MSTTFPVAVAHDHGYSYLHTKDVSGAVFEGASDGVIVRSNRCRLECDSVDNEEKRVDFLDIFFKKKSEKKMPPLFF